MEPKNDLRETRLAERNAGKADRDGEPQHVRASGATEHYDGPARRSGKASA